MHRDAHIHSKSCFICVKLELTESLLWFSSSGRTYLHSTMIGERLNGLVPLSIRRDIRVSPEQILDNFVQTLWQIASVVIAIDVTFV